MAGAEGDSVDPNGGKFLLCADSIHTAGAHGVRWFLLQQLGSVGREVEQTGGLGAQQNSAS